MDLEPGQLLGAIFSGSADGIVVVDTDGTIVLANEAIFDLFGYRPIELVGAPLDTLLPLDRRAAHGAHVARFFANPTPRSMGVGLELSGRRRDGDEFPVDISLAPVETRAGRFVAAFVRDSTERHRTLARFRAVNDVSHQLLGGATVADVLPTVARLARELSRAAVAWIMLPVSAGSLDVVAAEGQGAASLLGVRFDRTTSAAGEVLRTGRPDVIDDATSAPVVPSEIRALDLGPRFYVPLLQADRAMGVLAVGRAKDAAPFESLDIAVGELFAGAIAAALELGAARRELERLKVVGEDERIARALHDTVIQQLFAVGMSLQAVRPAIAGAPGDRVDQAIDRIDDVIKEIRNTIFQLPERETDSPGLRDILFTLTNQFSTELGFTPRVAFDGPIETAITGELREHTIAVCTEALSNAARHAGASRIDLVVAVQDGELILTIADDGVGCPTTASAGNGLRNLRERAALARGEFSVTSRDPRGTVVEWRAPLADARA